MGLKLKDLIKIGVGVGDIFTGGAASKVADIVQKSIDDKKDPLNEKAVKTLAEVDDVQNQAIVVLDQRTTDQEKRLKALEKQLGLS
jgi:hypothetical protein